MDAHVRYVSYLLIDFLPATVAQCDIVLEDQALIYPFHELTRD